MQKLFSIIFNNVMYIMPKMTCKKRQILKKKFNYCITRAENESISQKHVKPQHFKLDLIA